MTLNDFFWLTIMISGLALIRFGIPALVMWLLKLGCCRILHLEPQ